MAARREAAVPDEYVRIGMQCELWVTVDAALRRRRFQRSGLKTMSPSFVQEEMENRLTRKRDRCKTSYPGQYGGRVVGATDFVLIDENGDFLAFFDYNL